MKNIIKNLLFLGLILFVLNLKYESPYYWFNGNLFRSGYGIVLQNWLEVFYVEEK